MTDERQGKISASGAWILYQCSGSQRMQAGMPPEAPAAETLQGAEIAEAMASDDFKGLDDEGRTIAERLQGMVNNAMCEWQVTFPSLATPRILREVRMWLYDDNGTPIASAKPDFAAIRGNCALVIEEKSGYIQVHRADSNVQLRIQALCLTSEYPHVNQVVGAIAQHRFSSHWSSVLYGPKELDMARRELDLKLWMAEDIDAPLNAGEWCRYCRAKAVCPAAAAFSLLPVTTMQQLQLEPITEENVRALVTRLTLQQMAVLRKNKTIIEKILEAVNENLRSRSIAELNSVGLTLAKASEGKTITAPGRAQEILVNEKLITAAEFETCLDVVGGRIEKLVVDRIAERTGATKKDAKLAMWTLLQPVTTRKFNAAPVRPLKEDK